MVKKIDNGFKEDNAIIIRGARQHNLKDIDLEVAPQEKIVICGPSGSGKSTLIRCINRLEEHQKGNIVVDGRRASAIGIPRNDVLPIRPASCNV